MLFNSRQFYLALLVSIVNKGTTAARCTRKALSALTEQTMQPVSETITGKKDPEVDPKKQAAYWRQQHSKQPTWKSSSNSEISGQRLKVGVRPSSSSSSIGLRF
jgi:hypothetical protein